MSDARNIRYSVRASKEAGYFGQKYPAFGELLRDLEYDVARMPEDGTPVMEGRDQPRARVSAAVGDPALEVAIVYDFTDEVVTIKTVRVILNDGAMPAIPKRLLKT